MIFEINNRKLYYPSLSCA